MLNNVQNIYKKLLTNYFNYNSTGLVDINNTVDINDTLLTDSSYQKVRFFSYMQLYNSTSSTIAL